MKSIFLICMIAFFSLNANTSLGQAHEINKLDKEVELLLDSAAKHMVSFILTQKEAEYDQAMEKIGRAETMNEDLVKKSANEKGVSGKIEKEEIEERKEEIASYKKATLKADILNEKPAARKIKIKHKGETYNLSDKSKKSYDLFSSYLPKN